MLKAGCKTPQSWKYLKNIPAGSFPVLEKLERSQGGKGIILLRRKPNRGQPKARWYQKYIDKKREYRVFFFLDDITMVNEKIPKDRSQVTWNLHNSSWSGAYGLKGNANLKKIVLAGTKALNLDWGAADVLEDTRGNFWICEINSRPGCQNPGGEKARFRRNKNGIYEPVEGHAGGGSASMWANQFRKFLEKH
jgi:glutathione synthase/RimK-type ligase-like ATP-grasp enzyme